MAADKINVQGKEVTIITHCAEDYISLTDMVRGAENGLALIEKWLRNKNTIEFLGIWEEINNTAFNSPEFEGIKSQAGLNRFVLSVKQWVERTCSKGILAKAGRYGGTYASTQRLRQLNAVAIIQVKSLAGSATIKKLGTKEHQEEYAVSNGG